MGGVGGEMESWVWVCIDMMLVAEEVGCAISIVGPGGANDEPAECSLSAAPHAFEHLWASHRLDER